MADFQNPNLKLPYLHLILTSPKDCYQDLMGQYKKKYPTSAMAQKNNINTIFLHACMPLFSLFSFSYVYACM